MNKQEFSKWAMALRTFYPKEALLPNDMAMELWHRELKDIPYKVAEMALWKWVQTNKWSPSIADVRELAAEIQNPEIPDWGEAWEQVCTAIRRFGSYRQRDALESLDPLTRKTVERLGYLNLCRSENQAADRANFRTLYEMVVKREQTRQQVALPLQESILKLRLDKQSGMYLIGEQKK